MRLERSLRSEFKCKFQYLSGFAVLSSSVPPEGLEPPTSGLRGTGSRSRFISGGRRLVGVVRTPSGLFPGLFAGLCSWHGAAFQRLQDVVVGDMRIPRRRRYLPVVQHPLHELETARRPQHLRGAVMAESVEPEVLHLRRLQVTPPPRDGPPVGDRIAPSLDDSVARHVALGDVGEHELRMAPLFALQRLADPRVIGVRTVSPRLPMLTISFALQLTLDQRIRVSASRRALRCANWYHAW